MSILFLSVIGGLVSAVSTSAGSLSAPLFSKFETLRKYRMSMDFALGVMLSAVAFSLVGPEIMRGQHLSMVFSGLIAGAVFIYLTHKLIGHSTNKLLIAALVFHNLPEGMGAGASLAGMSLHDAIPLQVAISIQNVVEGLLLTLLLQGLGMKLSHAVIGGILSGLIEMTGAISAGLLMQETSGLLPFFLSLAGGAMMMSVILEIIETKKIQTGQFAGGLMVIPITNFLLG